MATIVGLADQFMPGAALAPVKVCSPTGSVTVRVPVCPHAVGGATRNVVTEPALMLSMLILMLPPGTVVKAVQMVICPVAAGAGAGAGVGTGAGVLAPPPPPHADKSASAIAIEIYLKNL